MADQDRGVRLVQIDDRDVVSRCLRAPAAHLRGPEGLAGLLVDSGSRPPPDHGVAALGVLAGFHRDGTLNHPARACACCTRPTGRSLSDGDRGGGPGVLTRAMRWCISVPASVRGHGGGCDPGWQPLVSALHAKLAAEAGLILKPYPHGQLLRWCLAAGCTASSA